MGRAKNPNAYEERKARLRKRYREDKEYREDKKRRSSEYYYRVLKPNPLYSEACKALYQLKHSDEALSR